MLKEAKKWVQTLEDTLTQLSKEFNKSIEELDDAFTEWYDNGGSDFDLGGPMSSPEAFASEYRADRKEEAESEAYDEVYKKMRAFAADRGYDLEDGESKTLSKRPRRTEIAYWTVQTGRSESLSKTGLLTTRNKQSVGLERSLRFSTIAIRVPPASVIKKQKALSRRTRSSKELSVPPLLRKHHLANRGIPRGCARCTLILPHTRTHSMR